MPRCHQKLSTHKKRSGKYRKPKNKMDLKENCGVNKVKRRAKFYVLCTDKCFETVSFEPAVKGLFLPKSTTKGVQYSKPNICLITTLVITSQSQNNESWLLRNNTMNSVVRFILIGNESQLYFDRPPNPPPPHPGLLGERRGELCCHQTLGFQVASLTESRQQRVAGWH